MLEYDPKVIHEHCQALYKQANRIILTWTIFGFVLGAVTGSVMATIVSRGSTTGPIAFVCALIGAVMGFSLGRQKAFMLKLQAQTALCQVRIEENTRK